jgi:hypothetical protein
MTAIPYGSGGVMFGLRADHDADEYGECRLCSPLPARAEFWQRGCPMTGLPVAPVWRAPVAGESGVDALDRAREAVAKVQRALADQQDVAPTWSGRATQWQAHDQAVECHRQEDGVERDASALAVDGAA